MNIEKAESGFTSICDIGRYAFFIHTQKDGAFVSFEELYDKAMHYGCVVVCGDNSLLQKLEIGKLFRKLVKYNSNIKLELHTDGTDKPVEVAGFANNITYNVFVPAVRPAGQRINENAMFWFVQSDANFIFEIGHKEHLEEAVSFINTFGVKKSKAFLTPTTNVDKIKQYAKYYGYNLAPKVEW